MIFVYVCSTWSSTWGMFELKTRFETWITRNDVNDIRLFHLSYLITLLANLCSQRTPNVQIKYFNFDWSIYSLFVLNTGWKRDSPNTDIRIYLLDTRHRRTKNSFLYVYNMKQRKWCKSVSAFLSKSTYGLPVLTKNTKCTSLVFYDWFVDIHFICTNFGLETWFSPNEDIRRYLIDMKNSWTKYAFCDVNNKKWRKWRKFVSPLLFNKHLCLTNAHNGYQMYKSSILWLIDRSTAYLCEIGPGNVNLSK
jgi:hypothetical protein